MMLSFGIITHFINLLNDFQTLKVQSKTLN